MSLAILNSCALNGINVPTVSVEVHVSTGLPAFTIVGLADTEVRESRERVRAALFNQGYDFPPGRVTVNLAPADLPKESGRYDLPIALGILLATGQLQLGGQFGNTPAEQAQTLSRAVLAGELSLSGALIPIQSALTLALGLTARQPPVELYLPEPSARLAAQIHGLSVWGARTLREFADHFSGARPLAPLAPADLPSPRFPFPCLSDVKGQASACRALEIAAAGQHHVLMLGSPGTGKSMLAARLPGLLPPLSRDETLAASALHTLNRPHQTLLQHRPFRSPHHSSSVVALVGGGARPRPGEISLAHHGVLFLDELAEFSRPSLEALREPLETRKISLARAAYRVDYPAHFQLVAAMNPCRCGWFGHSRRACRCTPDQVRAYQGKVSGPLLDRLDIHIELPPLPEGWLDFPPAPTSEQVRARVQAARQRQLQRQGACNAQLDADALTERAALSSEAQQLLNRAITRWSWSGRTVHRTMRLARTIADLEGAAKVAAPHMAEALSYRSPFASQAPPV